jgi:hypothetical protein
MNNIKGIYMKETTTEEFNAWSKEVDAYIENWVSDEEDD